MKTLALLLGASIASAGLAGPLPHSMRSTLPTGPMNERTPGRLLVKLRPSVVAQLFPESSGRKDRPIPVQFENLADEINGTPIRAIGTTGWTLWKVPLASRPENLAARAAAIQGVLKAQPVNRVYPLLTEPNDLDWFAIETGDPMVLDLLDEGNASFRRLWHITDTFAFESWNIWPNKYYTAAEKALSRNTLPLVAVVDTGLDSTHPDFANTGSASTDAAFGGQVEWNLSRQIVEGEPLPPAVGDWTDTNGHGTHVAGLVNASGNNGGFVGHGTLGTGYAARTMILRVFDSNNYGSDMDAAVAIYTAADSGAQVINLSLGTTNYSAIFQDAVTYAWQKGCLVIAAGNEAGSGGGNLGPIYPAACSGALAVTANGPSFVPANDNYAGYGYYVDIAAPGGNLVTYSQFEFALQYIWSTSTRYPCAISENPAVFPPYTLNYSYLIGTSMASPQVAGAAAHYFARFGLGQGNYNNVRAYRALEKSALGAGAPNGGWEYTQGYGSMDVEGLLLEADGRGATVGGVEGIVMFGGTPTPNVRVTAVRPGTNPRIPMQTTTKVDGTYRFDGLTPGLWDISARPFGVPKTKRVVIREGSDFTGNDFYCGPLLGDETRPTIGKFLFQGAGSNYLDFDQWVFDTESGIDSIIASVGTTPGGTNLLPPTVIATDTERVRLSGFTVPFIYSTSFRYTNGDGMVNEMRRSTHLANATTFVEDGPSAGTNFASWNQMSTRKASPGAGNRISYVRFDLTGVLPKIRGCNLRIFQHHNPSIPAGSQVQIYHCGGPAWSESGLNWNNRPPLGTLLATVPLSSSSWTYISTPEIGWTVLQALSQGRNHVTFAIVSNTTSSVAATYNGRNMTPNVPELRIASSTQ